VNLVLTSKLTWQCSCPTWKEGNRCLLSAPFEHRRIAPHLHHAFCWLQIIEEGGEEARHHLVGRMESDPGLMFLMRRLERRSSACLPVFNASRRARLTEATEQLLSEEGAWRARLAGGAQQGGAAAVDRLVQLRRVIRLHDEVRLLFQDWVVDTGEREQVKRTAEQETGSVQRAKRAGREQDKDLETLMGELRGLAGGTGGRERGGHLPLPEEEERLECGEEALQGKEAGATSNELQCTSQEDKDIAAVLKCLSI
jgi:hypothetical protein